jgi:hypothetical protein
MTKHDAIEKCKEVKRLLTSVKILETMTKKPLPKTKKVKKVHFELAPQTETDKLQPQIQQILIAIAKVLKEPVKTFTTALTTDESNIADFLSFYDYEEEGKKHLAKLSKLLGIKARMEDRLVVLAKKLKGK